MEPITTTTPKRRLTFDEVVWVKYNLEKKNPELKKLSVPEFAALANAQSEQFDFSAGLEDTFGKRVSRGINLALYPFSQIAEGIGYGIGDLFGGREIGGEIGRALPRGLLEVAPVMRGYNLLRAGEGIAAAAKTALPGLVSSGLKSYSETDSPLAGLVGAAGLAALPPMAQRGANIAAKLTPRLGGLFERGAEIAGRETAAALNQLATLQGTSLAATGELMPLDKKTLTELAAMQLPFTLLDIPYVLRGSVGPFRSRAQAHDFAKLIEKSDRPPEPPIKPEPEKPKLPQSLPELLENNIKTLEALSTGKSVNLNKTLVTKDFEDWLVKHNLARRVKPDKGHEHLVATDPEAIGWVLEGLQNPPPPDFEPMFDPDRLLKAPRSFVQRVIAPPRKFVVSPEGRIWELEQADVEASARAVAKLPKTPAEALVYLSESITRLLRQQRREVDAIFRPRGESVVVEIEHPIFGRGRYLREDLNQPITYTELEPGKSQVYLGGKPTNIIRLRNPLDDTYSYGVARGDEPNFVKPEVTRETLLSRVGDVMRKVSEVETRTFEMIAKLKENIFKQFNVKNERELLVAANLPKHRLVEWDTYLSRLRAMEADATQLMQQLLAVRSVSEAETLKIERMKPSDIRERFKKEFGDPFADVPASVKLQQLRSVSRMLQNLIEEALTVRRTRAGKWKEIVEKHTAYGKIKASLLEIDKALQRYAKTMPPDKAAERVYRAMIARVRKLTAFVDDLSDTVSLFNTLDEVLNPKGGKTSYREVMERLSVLEGKPWGRAALDAFVRFSSEIGKFQVRHGALDFGLMDDAAYFNVIRRLSELADDQRWHEAVKMAKEKFEDLDVETPSGQRAVALNYLRSSQKMVQSLMMSFNRATWRMVHTSEILQRLYEDLDESEVLTGLIKRLNETAVDWFDPSKEIVLEKSEILKEWFRKTFMVGDVKKDYQFWGTKTVELVTRSNGDVEAVIRDEPIPRLRGSGDIVKIWNRVLPKLWSGELEFGFNDGQLFIREPVNTESFLKDVGYSGTWDAFRKSVLPPLLGRLRYKFHLWLGTEEANEAYPMYATRKRPEQTPRVEGSPEEVMKQVRESPDISRVVETYRTFVKIFRDLGYSDDEADSLAMAASTITAAFKTEGRVSNIGEIPFEEAQKTNLIGATIYKDNVVYVGFSRLVNNLLKTHSLLFVHNIGHELSHAMFSKYRNFDLLELAQIEAPEAKILYMTRIMTAEERRMVMEKLISVLDPYWESSMASYYKNRIDTAATSESEFVADVLGIFATAHVLPKVREALGDLMYTGGFFESSLIKSVVPSVSDLFAAIKKVHEFQNPLAFDAAINPTEARPISWFLQQIFENAELLLKTADEIDTAIQGLKAVKALDGEVWNSPEFQRTVPVLGEEYSPMVWPEQVNRLVRYWFPSAQLAELHPKLRGPFEITRSFRAIANAAAKNVLEPILTVTKSKLPGGKVLTIDTELSGLKVLLTNERAERAASKIALMEQSAERLFTEGEIRKELAGESPEVIDAVLKWEKASTQVMERMAKQIVSVYNDLAIKRVATVQLYESNGIDSATAIQRAQQIVNEIKSGQPVLDPDTHFGFKASASFDEAKKQLELLGKLEKTLLGRPWFRTEMRFGRYAVSWVDPNGKHGFFAADTKEAIDKYVQKLQASGATSIRAWDKFERSDIMRSFNPEFMTILKEIEEVAYGNHVDNLVKQFGLPADVADALREGYIPLRQAARDMAEHSIEGFISPRKLTPGREDLNMVAGTLKYVYAMTHLLSKRVVTADFALALADPSLRGQDTLKRIAKDHFNNVVNPTGKELSLAKKLVFMHTLMFSPSQMIIELTQPLTTVIPQLIRDTGLISKTYKVFADIMEPYLKFIKHRTTGDKVLDRLIQKAVDEQVLDFGVLQELHDLEAIANLNLYNASTPERWVNAFKYNSESAFNWLFRMARDVYSYAPRINALTSFMAAYKAARDIGLLEPNGTRRKLVDERELYDYAKRTVGLTLFGGGTAARPVGLFANKGGLQGAVGLMYSLQTFTFSTIAMYARFARDAYRGNPAAKKALGNMILAQSALGGALSLPFAGALLAVVEQLFPELETRRNLEEATRNAVAALLGDPAAEFVADMALRGLPTVVGGIDMSNRLALSNLLGVSPYDGFSWENFVGPAGSILGNMFRAIRDFNEGHVGHAFKSVVPSSLKPTVDLLIGKGVPITRGGEPIIHLNAAEKALYVLGFRPARLAKAKQAIMLAEQHDRVMQNKLATFHRNLAARLVAGEDPAKIAAEIELKKQEYGDLFDVDESKRSVAEKATAMHFAFDPSRTGVRIGAPVRYQLARAAGIPVSDEFERYQMKKALEAALGLRGRGRIGERLKMALIQDLIESGMSRQQALLGV